MNLPLEYQPDKTLPTKTRGWVLVVASCFAIFIFPVFRYSPLFFEIAKAPFAQAIIGPLNAVIGLVCCMWLTARRTTFFDKEKWIALVILLSSTLFPYIAMWFFYFRFRENEFARTFLPLISLAIGFVLLNIAGFLFFSRLTGLHLVSHRETRHPKRLSVGFFFLASFFLAIPLALQIWIRKFIPTEATFVDLPEILMMRLIRDLIEVAFCGTLAMVYANSSWKNRFVATLFFVTNYLASSLVLFYSVSRFSSEAGTNAVNRSFSTNLFAMQFLSKYLFLALAFWLIYLAGYRWRIARRGVGFSQGANSSSMEINPLNDD